ncbi:DUF928 domain-containing protein [Leptolyngbya sp. FACHB-261]|uniref:DUF928 domain-containing protein n=1 Tax=Leptolyngbya sp. FACHB-261 TaxID=2692806 RepID=UPI0016836672|nr:DUF928 domain-containing protein [Leptolyngbya sp. FACHB-261]MBD2103049.1 DUF928 domain-containing protein [Leptolyngbya sp. FACHB-261]
MPGIKAFYQSPFFCPGLAATLVSLLGPTTIAFTPAAASPTNPAAGSKQYAPPHPPSTGLPGGRQGAGSRDPLCPAGPQPLTALVPLTQTSASEPAEAGGGLTTAAYPTFWFYVPYTTCPLEFVLKDDRDGYIYRTTLAPVGRQPGVVSVRLPETGTPLEVGRAYHWYFSVIKPRSGDPITFVDGSVRRVAASADLSRQLASATPQQRSALYAANDIWYDSLTSLGELRRTQPQNAALARTWADLLGSIGLDKLATEPVVGCCEPQR